MSRLKSAYRYLKQHGLRTAYHVIMRFQKEQDIGAFLRGAGECALFITHAWGGGTRQFEQNWLAESGGRAVVCRIRAYRANLAFSLEDVRNARSMLIRPQDFPAVLAHSFTHIIVNSLVSLYDIATYAAMLTERKCARPDTPLIYNVHDFHSVCPTINLIAGNWNCRLDCGKHCCAFDCARHRYAGTIDHWRALWHGLLSCADEIRCFSEDSRRIMRSAFPRLDEGKFRVMPHRMDWCRFTRIAGLERLPFHLGIVGTVSAVAKGKLVVQELLRRLPEDIPVTVIGATRRQLGTGRRKNVRYLGAYRHDDLQRLVERRTISTVIFPSIWSETFSYLVSEHIIMGLPVICFDMGAQAEKVRACGNGTVCRDTDDMVAAVLRLWHERHG